MPNIGPMEIAIVLIVLLLIFGPKKLPELGRTAGKGLREFRTGLLKRHDADEVEPVSGAAETGEPAGSKQF